MKLWPPYGDYGNAAGLVSFHYITLMDRIVETRPIQYLRY
jgi:hypothetical protein